MYTSTHAYIYRYTHIYIFMYIYMHVCMHACMCEHVYTAWQKCQYLVMTEAKGGGEGDSLSTCLATSGFTKFKLKASTKYCQLPFLEQTQL